MTNCAGCTVWAAVHGSLGIATASFRVSALISKMTVMAEAQLERMLAGKGYNMHVANAGINGNTNADMLARLDQAVPAGTKVVLLGTLGGRYNARRLGQGDQNAEFASIMAKLRSRGIKIIQVNGAGVTRKHLQVDGVHLTAEGHAAVAARLLPSVIRALGH